MSNPWPVPDRESQSVLPETSGRLRRLIWIFFVPLAVLAGIGAYYLTTDRKLAYEQARTDAHDYLHAAIREISLSNCLAPALRLENGNLVGMGPGAEPEAVILRDFDGNDRYPYPENAFVSELDLPELTGELSRLWSVAEETEFREPPSVAIVGYREFLKANPPLNHQYEARYRKGMLALRDGKQDRARREIKVLLEDTPPFHPVHQRAHWFRITQIPDSWTSDFEAACASWILAPNTESMAMLEKVKDEETWQHRPHVRKEWRSVVQEGMKRLERENRARKLSPQIHNLFSSRDWKRMAYLSGGPETLFVMRRQVSGGHGNGHLLVAWTPGQLGKRIQPLLAEEKLGKVRRPGYVNNVLVKLDGRGIWGRTWPTRSQWRLLAADSFADLKMAPIATNMLGGFEIVASAAPGAIAWESNKRIAWFAMLILGAGAISVLAWKSTRQSVLHLDALNQEKSNFVSSVSHELRAPVASMQLMAESLHEGKIEDGDKQKEYFGMILQECRRLGSLVHNVLDFARIEQRRKEYQFSNCDMADLIHHTVNVMKPAAEECDIRLTVDTVALEAEVDAGAIQQALINLLDNAVKFSPPKSEVVVRLSDPDGDGIRIAVSDRGPGIPEELREKIFERFYRNEDELRRETKGVGIGLSIVKHIVEAHGGRVQVAENEHQGAVFVIEIPSRKPGKDHVANPAG